MADMKKLTSMKELEEAFEQSYHKPVFIFKHSEICPISRGAYGHYQAFVKEYENDDFIFTLIMIRENRELSNEVATKTNVKHESPQAILVKDGEALWDDSHYEITQDKLEQVVMMYENKTLTVELS